MLKLTLTNKNITTAIQSWPAIVHFRNSGTFPCITAASCSIFVSYYRWCQ